MRLPLDTHAFLWFLKGRSFLPPPVYKEIENAQNQSFVSIASLWEISIKISIGKLKMPAAFADFPEALDASGIGLLPISTDHLKTLRSLPMPHKDPFDRLIIAQALNDGFTIVTKDPAFTLYNVPHFWKES
jgi:PIN domain nuclease of toxin-antitoxin system